MEERERDRRDLSSVSLSAVPLFLFVNTLARPLLAKSQVRPQRFRFSGQSSIGFQIQITLTHSDLSMLSPPT